MLSLESDYPPTYQLALDMLKVLFMEKSVCLDLCGCILHKLALMVLTHDMLYAF